MKTDNPKKEAEGINVVLVGAFNPAIFHPEWYLRHELIQEGSPEASQVVSPQVSQIQIDGVTVTCLPERLTFETGDPIAFSRVQDLAIGTLRLLPHTPVTAIGINRRIHWGLNDEAHWHKIGHALAPKDGVWNGLLENPGMRSLRIQSPSGQETRHPGNITVTVEPSRVVRPGLYVAVNLEFRCNSEESGLDSAGVARDVVLAEWDVAEGWADKASAKIFEKIPSTDKNDD